MPYSPALKSRFEQRGSNTDLYSTFSMLTNCSDKSSKISVDDLGRIYAVTILLDVPEKMWLSKKNYTGDAEREAKKAFQETTRIELYRMAHDLNALLNPDNDILKYYIERSEELDVLFKTTNGTIEHEIKRMLSNFEKIGEGIFSGAKNYYNEKPDEVKSLKYKVFLEYDRILKGLRRVV